MVAGRLLADYGGEVGDRVDLLQVRQAAFVQIGAAEKVMAFQHRARAPGRQVDQRGDLERAVEGHCVKPDQRRAVGEKQMSSAIFCG